MNIGGGGSIRQLLSGVVNGRSNMRLLEADGDIVFMTNVTTTAGGATIHRNSEQNLKSRMVWSYYLKVHKN